MVTKPIGHSALIKRYESKRREIKRLRDVIARRDETIRKLKEALAKASTKDIAYVMARPRCGCRH